MLHEALRTAQRRACSSAPVRSLRARNFKSPAIRDTSEAAAAPLGAKTRSAPPSLRGAAMRASCFEVDITPSLTDACSGFRRTQPERAQARNASLGKRSSGMGRACAQPTHGPCAEAVEEGQRPCGRPPPLLLPRRQHRPRRGGTRSRKKARDDLGRLRGICTQLGKLRCGMAQQRRENRNLICTFALLFCAVEVESCGGPGAQLQRFVICTRAACQRTARGTAGSAAPY